MSRVPCHLSSVTGCVTCHLSNVAIYIFFNFLKTKQTKLIDKVVWSLLVEGCLLTGPTPSSFHCNTKGTKLSVTILCIKDDWMNLKSVFSVRFLQWVTKTTAFQDLCKAVVSDKWLFYARMVSAIIQMQHIKVHALVISTKSKHKLFVETAQVLYSKRTPFQKPLEYLGCPVMREWPLPVCGHYDVIFRTSLWHPLRHLGHLGALSYLRPHGPPPPPGVSILHLKLIFSGVH